MTLRIGIIGGGLSGTLVALKILQDYKRPVQILLFEKKPAQIFRGIAYSSQLKFQPLNVRAMQMNIDENRPGDFCRWLKTSGKDYLENIPEAHDFVRRDVFGHYLQDSFQHELRKSQKSGSLKIIYQEVLALTANNKQLNVSTSIENYDIDYAVLALGNFLPGDPQIKNTDFYKTDFYEPNPWSATWMTKVKREDDVLFLGSGLTTIDQVINLLSNGHTGKIKILSRRGFIPKAHKTYKPSALPPLNLYLGMSLGEVIREVKKQIDRYTNSESDWRNVIDSIRGQVPLIWAYLSLDERRRFLRHVRPFWEVHRHRIPEESLEIIETGIRRGQIEVLAGRLIDVEIVSDYAIASIALRGTSVNNGLNVKKVINCTGPQTDYRKIEQPLLKSLISQGWLHTDELNLGLAVNPDGQLINDGGKPIHNIYTMGSLRKGAMWECTALKEIALQAKQFVHKLNSESVSYTV
jgi:uncharacterized NAD(P)/FAD-binding protein YdhS